MVRLKGARRVRAASLTEVLPPMSQPLLSDSAETVDALASWLEDALPLESRPCAVLAHALLCRKELKIKRGAINQVLKSLNVDERFGEVREKLVTSGLLRKISGQNGSTIYAIDLEAAGIEVPELPVEPGHESSHGPATESAGELRADAAEIPAEVVEVTTVPKDRPKSSAPSEESASEQAPSVSDASKKQRQRKRERSRGGEVLRAQRETRARAKREMAPEVRPSRERGGALRLLDAGKKLTGAMLHRDRAETRSQVQSGKQGKKSVQADDFERLRAWLAENDGKQLPYVTRRQRAYQIFDDEKALEGKRGERLMRRLASKGLNPGALRISSHQTPPLQGFFSIGSDQPFIVVENIDAYEEIMALLKARRHVRLFGTRVGGVIFGAGHNICMAHALDDYLHGIGYAYDYVYYAGDIDREGARLVEKAREVNVVGIRLHAGMYRAMFEAHRAHMRQGSSCESAAKNQDCPRSLVGILKGLPWSLRIPFKRALQDNIRIPQEVLTSDDFRRGSLVGVDRLLER